MPRTLNRINSRKIYLMPTGCHGDGGGLYLLVKPSGTRSWVFRFMLRGRAREMGLGPTHTISLAEARGKALDCRRKLLDGVDPIDARNTSAAMQLEAQRHTFRDCALAYIRINKVGWRNGKHADQWESTLTTYAFPRLGNLSVSDVNTRHVLEVLEPMWPTKPETATRVRSRIEAVLSWATVRGYRAGDNPARWRGHLENSLPRRSKVAAVRHHPALPFAEAAAFMKELRAQPGLAARALEFIILTAARTGEVIGAKWTEVDFDNQVWIVPGERMKAGRAHKVPLSPMAMRILEPMREAQSSDFIFPAVRRGRPLSNMACLAVLKRMERQDLTVHGFRSTFRDWAAECTDFPGEVVEAGLAHVISDKVEAAYRRGDLFNKRRELMKAWAQYCGRTPKGEGDTASKKTFKALPAGSQTI